MNFLIHQLLTLNYFNHLWKNLMFQRGGHTSLLSYLFQNSPLRTASVILSSRLTRKPMNKPSTFQIIMKRFLLVFGCGAILAASVSCTKDTTVAPEVKKGAIEIIASVDGTRTSLEGANVLWSANDALGIFSGTKFVNAQFTTTDDKSASATFTGDATDAEGTEAAKAFAYYPYAAGATLEGTTVSGLEIPAEQTFSEGTFATTLNPMAAVGEDHTTLAFRSVAAVLRFKLTGTDTFNKLILTGNNGESIAGAYALDFSGDVPAMTFSGDGKSITVKCASDMTLKADVATVIHFVVPAGIEFSQGISLKIVRNQFDYDEYAYVDKEILTRTFTTPLTTAANKLYNVTEFKVEDLSKGMDANLRAYLLKEYDANKDGLLSQAEAESVTEIYSAGFDGNVSSLGYIERLPNLAELVINSNCQELYGLTLSNNTKLTKVTLSPTNGLWSRLEVNNLPALESFELNFSNDQANLSKIDLSNCTALKKVVIKGAKSLETLDLTGSASTVEMFWLQSCPKMTTVDIHEMHITTFASADYASSGTNMFADGTMIIATLAQKSAMADRYSDYDVSVTWWCVDEERTEVAENVDPVLRAAILGDDEINPAGEVNTVITAEMAAKVTAINILSFQSIEGLASFEGLDAFPNLTKLNIQGSGQLDAIDLSAYTNLTDITMSPSKGYNSIKLPSSVVKFTSICSGFSSIGPLALDLTSYTNLEVVMVANNASGSTNKLASLNCKGLSKLHTLYAGNCASVNISGCDLLQTYNKGNDSGATPGFAWAGSSGSQTITVGSEAQRDALKASYAAEWWDENPYNNWIVE